MRVRLIQNESNKKRVPNKADGRVVKISRINKNGNYVLESWRSDWLFNKNRTFKFEDFEIVFSTIQYKSMRNDIFADLWCPICTLNDDGLNTLNKLKFSGYNDNYFFDVVNKDFRYKTCEHCGTRYKYKWTRDDLVISVDKVRS